MRFYGVRVKLTFFLFLLSSAPGPNRNCSSGRLSLVSFAFIVVRR